MSDEGEMVAGDGWISDDSSFYGDEDEQERLKELSEQFDCTHYWLTYGQRLNTIVTMYRLALEQRRPSIELHNPYEGQKDAWQLGESIADFTNRLPPVTSQVGQVGPWIWVSNPYREGQGKSGDILAFKERGDQLLEAYRMKRRWIEAENPWKAKGTVTRKLAAEREVLKQQITELATSTGVTHGKWMFFPTLEDLPRIWRLIAEGVVENRLGTSAKVATDDGTPSAASRLICVYTRDFSDTDDVLRMLKELVDMGLVNKDSPRGIYYKCDAYTWLEINSDNEYGIRASIYSSKEMLASTKKSELKPAAQKQQSTLVGFLRQ
ncbi:DUF1917-domain-containing protein [Lepidopterella palustris CBS 459.81]|uniref:DUF1917-domain-containing protein n=1 Tax=Lepidopterella palustris CBS 459.81 TaxID=1314670 RepID=A0A8E2E8U7_9PEZI|nr:DUF1917-domain-containing protein [Lepidopterella palustris CBS 459.81]